MHTSSNLHPLAFSSLLRLAIPPWLHMSVGVRGRFPPTRHFRLGPQCLQLLSLASLTASYFSIGCRTCWKRCCERRGRAAAGPAAPSCQAIFKSLPYRDTCGVFQQRPVAHPPLGVPWGVEAHRHPSPESFPAKCAICPCRTAFAVNVTASILARS